MLQPVWPLWLSVEQGLGVDGSELTVAASETNTKQQLTSELGGVSYINEESVYNIRNAFSHTGQQRFAKEADVFSGNERG